jgi:hypothetical protein
MAAEDVYIAEYNSLRSELLQRMQTQFTAVTWLFTAVAAVFAAFTFGYEKMQIHDLQRLAVIAALFCPIVVAPIAFMTFDHTLMIHRIGAYIATTIQPALSVLVANNGVLKWDPLKDAPRGTITSIRYFFFLLGSWLLYFLLIPVTTAVVTWGMWWQWPYPSLLVIDWLLTLAFLYSSLAIWNERAGWLKLRQIKLPF